MHGKEALHEKSNDAFNAEGQAREEKKSKLGKNSNYRSLGKSSLITQVVLGFEWSGR